MDAKKSFIVGCVNDALKMEKSIYTLNEIANECHSRANNIQANAKTNKNTAEKRNSGAKQYLEQCKNSIKSEKKHFLLNFTKEEQWGSLFKRFTYLALICFTLTCIIFVSITLLFHINKLRSDQGLVSLIFGAMALAGIFLCKKTKDKRFKIATLIVLIVFIYILTLYISSFPIIIQQLTLVFVYLLSIAIFLTLLLSERNLRMEYEKNKLKQAEDDCKTAEHNLQIANNNFSNAERECALLREQANICQRKANEIQKVLTDFYVYTNVIPISYRKPDCVIIFHHVFLNDLADTMREAVFYYEEKCFRNGVISGLKNIADKIDLLAVEMQDVGREIHAMNDNVVNLTDKAEKISQSMSISNDLQRQSIQETQATRYAVESLNHSVERYNYYRNH